MKLTIVGASGHGKVVADIARKCGYDKIDFLDDDMTLVSCAGYPVIGPSERCVDVRTDIFIAIGDARIRKCLMERCSEKRMPILIHPNAVVSDDAKIDRGTVVMAGTVINPGCSIGRGVIVNTSSSIDHDCIVHDYAHISVGAHLCGTVEVGAGTWIGAGSTISNNVSICGDSIVGAGAVVVRDIREPGTYVGVLATRIGKQSKHGFGN